MNAQERLEIYKQMLVDFSLESPEERDVAKADVGICYYLYHKMGWPNDKSTLRLPEIFDQEPSQFFDGLFWFPTMYFDREVGPDLNRIKVIEKAIEQVKTLL